MRLNLVCYYDDSISRSGFASFFLLFALVLITSLLGQYSEILYSSMRSLSNRHRYDFEEEKSNKELFKALVNTSTNKIISRNIYLGDSSLVSFSNVGDESKVGVLFVENKTRPSLLWRKFMLNTNHILECESTLLNNCEISSYSLKGVHSIISRKNEIKNKLIANSNNNKVLALGTSGSLFINNIELGSSKIQDEAPNEDIILIAAFENLYIDEITPLSIGKTLILYSTGMVEIGQNLSHYSCSKFNSSSKTTTHPTLRLLIYAKEIRIEGSNINDLDYSSCIQEALPEWFISRKLVGFVING